MSTAWMFWSGNAHTLERLGPHSLVRELWHQSAVHSHKPHRFQRQFNFAVCYVERPFGPSIHVGIQPSEAETIELGCRLYLQGCFQAMPLRAGLGRSTEFSPRDSAVRGRTSHFSAVNLALSLPRSNGQTDGHVNQLKLVKRLLDGEPVWLFCAYGSIKQLGNSTTPHGSAMTRTRKDPIDPLRAT